MRAIKMLVAALALQGAIEASAQTQLFHPTNAVWRYQTSLTEQQAAGADWITPGFVDSAWPQGVGLFGNDAGYPYAMNTTIPGATPIAVYYRSHFSWSGTTAGVVFTGTNYVDDGSIIYLNGVEIARFNMPATANAGTPDALAPAANPGGFPNVNGGEPVLVRLQIDLGALTNGNSNPLVTGDNVVAVQVHQNSATSSDRVFGLALYGSQSVAPCFTGTQPTNRTILIGRSTTFVATESCGIPAPVIQWYRNVGGGEELITGAVGATYTLTNAVLGDSGQYYAKAVNSKGTATSPQATLTVTSDGVGPVLLSARLGANNFEIIAVVDEALCTVPADCGNDSLFSFNWEIINADNPLETLVVNSIALNGLNVVFTLDPTSPWLGDTRYTVRAVDIGGQTGIGDLYGNLMALGSSATTAPAASAISVKSPDNASDLYTFDFPPSALEFTTSAMGGGAGDQTTAAGFDAPIQALDAATITTGLASATGTPPGATGLGQYASDGKYLITRPTGVLANNLVAHLRNDTGSAKSSLRITYTLGAEVPVAEEVPGHVVYFSLTGAAGSWVVIPTLTGDGVAGAKDSGDIGLGTDAWAAGASLYVVWVDDNGSGSPDIAYEIDNLQFKASTLVPPDNTHPTLTTVVAPNNTTILLTFSEKMAASAGTTAPYTITGSSVTAASLSGDGREVTLTTSARPVGIATLTITGVRDAAVEANLITPNPTTVKITTQQKIADWNTAWEYATNAQTGATWTTTGGTGWQTGNALFGTETSAGVVAIMPTPIATVIPPPNTANDFMVAYFRKQITLPAIGAGQAYAIGHITDDGLVAYIDGVEIGRFNMPAGPVTSGTPAVAGIEGSLQSLPFLATAGNHTLAVEVHQNANTSSDMLFGASVLVIPTAPALSISHVGTNAVVSWSADASWVLTGSTNVAGPYTAVGGAASPSFSRPIATPATQFYKLNYIPQP